MKKNYNVKISKETLQELKDFWRRLVEMESSFYGDVRALEAEMSVATGITGIEFFRCDGEYVGIGTSLRTMKLIQEDKLR